jgi:hypothetical protein
LTWDSRPFFCFHFLSLFRPSRPGADASLPAVGGGGGRLDGRPSESHSLGDALPLPPVLAPRRPRELRRRRRRRRASRPGRGARPRLRLPLAQAARRPRHRHRRHQDRRDRPENQQAVRRHGERRVPTVQWALARRGCVRGREGTVRGGERAHRGRREKSNGIGAGRGLRRGVGCGRGVGH